MHPHGFCYLWNPALTYLHVISDSVIALSYFSIPLSLIYYLYRRGGFLFSQILLLFAAFICFCGLTHLLSIWNVWHSAYWVSGIAKAFTALISFTTAVVLLWLIPKGLALLEQEQENKRQRSELVSKLSHEYLTPLTVILSSAQLLGCRGDEREKKHLGKIKQSVDKLSELTRCTLSAFEDAPKPD